MPAEQSVWLDNVQGLLPELSTARQEDQSNIKQGKKANEAGYLVGYNSPAQFSREYKRHFGYSPSAT
jgi:AraC-like DNA-binding protein